MGGQDTNGAPAALTGSRLSDQVHAVLRERILTGDLAPGERLVELELARTLAVSQAPVRDALIRLAHDGLVVQSPRRGSYVATVERTEALQVYALRAELEPYAAAEFCASAEDDAFADLATAVEAMHAAAARDDLAGLVEADMTFHRLVYSGSRHPVLPRVWSMLENTMRAFTAVSNRVVFRSLEEIAATHDPLLRSLRARDADSARHLFRAHVQYVWSELDRPDDEALDGDGATGA